MRQTLLWSRLFEKHTSELREKNIKIGLNNNRISSFFEIEKLEFSFKLLRFLFELLQRAKIQWDV